MQLTGPLPAPLESEGQQQLAQLLEELPALEARLEDATLAAELRLLLAASPFCAQLLKRRPQWLLELLDSGDLERGLDTELLERVWREEAGSGEPDSDEALHGALRRLRNRQYLRLIWRDFNGWADLLGTTAELSLLADWCIDKALDFHYRLLCNDWGTPTSEAGEVLRLVVLGMGKLGARELNLSSDVDLIFAYPEAGETRGGRRSLSSQEFFIRLGQRVIKALDQPGAEGFVFRVDMRLRPYGSAGALALSFDAMEEYYQDQGRDWERYALLKARAVAGDIAAGERLLADLKPFVYRRYLDFSAIESLRAMKAMIRRDVSRRRLQDNIKLGPGGIREIEFIVQCFQLIRGGREPVLQERHLLKVLGILEELGYLPQEAVDDLRAAYIFLRDTEHALQGFNDQQTQELPQADYPRAVLAQVMGEPDWEAFCRRLEYHRERVSTHFAAVVAAPEEDADSAGEVDTAPWLVCWRDELGSDAAVSRLDAAGHEDAPEAARLLAALRCGNTVQKMQSVGRERLDAFMPQLLEAVTHAARPTETLLRILPLLEAVLRRTAYLVLLVENPPALRQLVVLCAASPYIAQQLAKHPVLLDELLDPRTLYQAPDRAELNADLRQQLLRLPWEDLEAQMEGLRYFKLAHILRVAASEVTGRLPLMKVSDYLTWIAEVILEHVLELAWQNLVARHGRPCKVSGEVCDKDFIIVGYGKLGGIELGHGSDLDLVFIHDADPDGVTDGERSVDNSMFFTRLGQRIIHILTTQTPLGPLYEVDMRLRPSGASGLLVSTLRAFTEYQQDGAWTWEHQALVRARSVAGDPHLMERFETVRAQVLARERDPHTLREEVMEMRRKMREHLLSRERDDATFDLKQARGAIVDIEFVVQYAVLAWSHEYPSLTRYTDNIRVLEVLEQEGLLSATAARDLREAYKAFRAAQHRLSLQRQPLLAPAAEFSAERAAVQRSWEEILGAPPP